MNDTAIQQKIVELARRYGKSVSQLTQDEYLRFSLAARKTFSDKIDAVSRAATSMVKTQLLGIRVSPEIASSNKETCEKCPSSLYTKLADGTPSCSACGCAGRFLISKWADPTGECPRRHWSNLGQVTVSARPDTGNIDSNGGDAARVIGG